MMKGNNERENFNETSKRHFFFIVAAVLAKKYYRRGIMLEEHLRKYSRLEYVRGTTSYVHFLKNTNMCSQRYRFAAA